MSEKLTPEQIETITRAVEAHLNTTGQNVNSQALLTQLPSLLTGLVTGPAGGAIGLLTTLLSSLTGSLTGITSSILGSNLAPQLVNIIKEHVPMQQQAPVQQPDQQ